MAAAAAVDGPKQGARPGPPRRACPPKPLKHGMRTATAHCKQRILRPRTASTRVPCLVAQRAQWHARALAPRAPAHQAHAPMLHARAPVPGAHEKHDGGARACRHGIPPGRWQAHSGRTLEMAARSPSRTAAPHAPLPPRTAAEHYGKRRRAPRGPPTLTRASRASSPASSRRPWRASSWSRPPSWP